MTGGRVMVVEDDPDVRLALMEVLEDEGFEVSGAVNGRDALDKLRAASNLPDVILLDLLMPELDGAGFRVEQLKDDRLRTVATVIVSANARLAAVAESLAVETFLAKPVSLPALLSTVNRLVDARS